MDYICYIRFTRGQGLNPDISVHSCEVNLATNIFSGEIDENDLILVRNDMGSVCMCLFRGSREDCEQAAQGQYPIELQHVIDIFVRKCRDPNIDHMIDHNETIRSNLNSYSNNIFNCYPLEHFADNRFLEFRQMVRMLPEANVPVNRRPRRHRRHQQHHDGFMGDGAGNNPGSSGSESGNEL